MFDNPNATNITENNFYDKCFEKINMQTLFHKFIVLVYYGQIIKWHQDYQFLLTKNCLYTIFVLQQKCLLLTLHIIFEIFKWCFLIL